MKILSPIGQIKVFICAQAGALCAAWYLFYSIEITYLSLALSVLLGGWVIVLCTQRLKRLLKSEASGPNHNRGELVEVALMGLAALAFVGLAGLVVRVIYLSSLLPPEIWSS